MQRGGSILLVEDDVRLGDLLDEYLREHGFVIARATDGRDAIARITRDRPDAVVLDLMIPTVDGLDVLRAVRPVYAGGVLILTANKREVDQVVGLELGADDFVTKPVDPRVLLARLRSLLRRLGGHGEVERRERITVGTLTIDRAARAVEVSGRAVDLTSAEFNLLWVLALRAGEVVTRDDLYREGLGARYDGLDRGVDIHLSRTRRKLGDAGFEVNDLKSVRGVGYQLARRL